MRQWFKQTSNRKRKAVDLYGKLVAAARSPGFYGPGRVSDTPEGRFELIALHLFLVAERVKVEQPDGEDLAQSLIEAFVTDMDDCMREMGVGDLTVPKRVKRAAAVFYEQGGAYRAALDAADRSASRDGLETILARYLLNAETTSTFSSVLASYVRACQTSLAQTPFGDILNGDVPFAPPPAPPS